MNSHRCNSDHFWFPNAHAVLSEETLPQRCVQRRAGCEESKSCRSGGNAFLMPSLVLLKRVFFALFSHLPSCCPATGKCLFLLIFILASEIELDLANKTILYQTTQPLVIFGPGVVFVTVRFVCIQQPARGRFGWPGKRGGAPHRRAGRPAK